jgi:hypothetical protein
MELSYFLINGLGGPLACHMGHIGFGPHPKSKHALRITRILTDYAPKLPRTWLGEPMIGENWQLVTDEPVEFEK